MHSQYIELTDFDLWITVINEMVKRGLTFRAYIVHRTVENPYVIELTGGY